MPNTLDSFIPQILERAIPVLRNNLVIPRFMTRESNLTSEAANQGDHITLTDVGDLVANAVVPANVAPDPQNIVTSQRTIPIDQWTEVPFQLNDKELQEVEAGLLPRVVEKAVIALATHVESYLITQLLKGLPYSVGTPGTAPFQNDLQEFFDASVIMDENQVPMTGRSVILNPRAYNNAMQNRALQDTSWRGNSRVMNDRQIVNALGADWLMTQSLTARTQGTGSAYEVVGAQAKGVRFFPIDTGSGTWLPGDVFTVAGDTVPHAVVSYSGGVMTFAPGLSAAVSDNALLTRVASNGVPNLLIHEDAAAFVNRPLAQDPVRRRAGAVFAAITDPESGLTMRLELLNEHKRVRWSVDMLYGAGILNEKFGTRIYG